MAEEEKKIQDESTESAVEDSSAKTEETKEESKKETEKEAADNEQVAEDAMEGLSSEGKKLIESVEKMTVLELNKLVKAIEQRFGVSAQAVAVAGPGAGGGDSGEEEKDSFTVELKDIGGQKIAVIKVVKALLGLGLKDAKDLVDAAPSILKEGVKKEEAEDIKKQIEEAGGTVELK